MKQTLCTECFHRCLLLFEKVRKKKEKKTINHSFFCWKEKKKKNQIEKQTEKHERKKIIELQ